MVLPLKQPSAQSSATLILENGAIFKGISIGAQGHTMGEIVFNTAMTGYQEVLTDPSYAGQMIAFTYPHIGNVGIHEKDYESKAVWAKGVILKSLTQTPSSWRATASLDAFLKAQGVIGIHAIDTRYLLNILRTHSPMVGGLWGCITSDYLSTEQPQWAIYKSKVDTVNYVKDISTKTIYQLPVDNPYYHIVVYDFGVKQSILEALHHLNCTLTIVPWNTSIDTILVLQPDGVVLSNGPGDPKLCHDAMQTTKILLEKGVPILGICLGHQILALACGAHVSRLPIGHHGSNHPILHMETKHTFITSQNHNYAVEEHALPTCLKVTHISLIDHTIQGIQHISKLAMGLQGHPEASPGPHDMYPIFQSFLAMMRHAQRSCH